MSQLDDILISSKTLTNRILQILWSLLTLLLALGIVFSAPILILRVIVILLAKLFRSDLKDIVSLESALYLNDYFAKTNPHCNIVLTMTFKGRITYEEVKSRVLKHWINAKVEGKDKLLLEKFQQYPSRWLGFTFWEDATDTFNIDNHVYRLYGNEVVVREHKLQEVIEYQINSRIPEHRSPWAIYVIENYCPKYISRMDSKMPKDEEHYSVAIVKWHHTLADGMGMMSAVVNGLFEESPVAKISTAKPLLPKRSLKQSISCILGFLLFGSLELFSVFYSAFRKSLWKLKDSQNSWYQVHFNSQPIPVQLVKDIKNEFEVSFESVIWSATSAAVYKMMNELRNDGNLEEKMFCMSSQPGIGVYERNVLDSHVTAITFDLSVKRFDSPVERVKMANKVLQRVKQSTLPLQGQLFAKLVGAHLNPVCDALSKNRTAIALSNVVGKGKSPYWNENCRLVQVQTNAGGLAGEHGVFILVVSAENELTINVTAERALMTRHLVQKFVNYMIEEIKTLGELVQKAKCFTDVKCC